MDGLNIFVSSFSPPETTTTAGDMPKLKSKSKAKSKAKGEGKELIVDAHLRLKTGVHYGLLGRNGTGKSSE